MKGRRNRTRSRSKSRGKKSIAYEHNINNNGEEEDKQDDSSLEQGVKSREKRKKKSRDRSKSRCRTEGGRNEEGEEGDNTSKNESMNMSMDMELEEATGYEGQGTNRAEEESPAREGYDDYIGKTAEVEEISKIRNPYDKEDRRGKGEDQVERIQRIRFQGTKQIKNALEKERIPGVIDVDEEETDEDENSDEEDNENKRGTSKRAASMFYNATNIRIERNEIEWTDGSRPGRRSANGDEDTMEEDEMEYEMEYEVEEDEVTMDYDSDEEDSYVGEIARVPSAPLVNQVRVVSYNARNGLRSKADELVEYLERMLCDYATIQEPTALNKEITDMDKKRWRRIAEGRGYHAIFTQHQWVFIKNRFAKRIIKPPVIVEQGRLIITEFLTSNNSKWLIIGAYGVSADASKTTKERLERDGLRKALLDKVDKHKKNFDRECKEGEMAGLVGLYGDLQDTVTKGTMDNQGCRGQEKNKVGLLQWSMNEDNEMISSSYEHHKKNGQQYITRTGTAGGRGIDHLMGNDKLHKCFQQTGIDKHGVHILVNPSDHHLIFGDYDISNYHNWKDGEVPKKTKIRYGLLCGIKVKPTQDEQGNITGYEYDTKLEGKELEEDEGNKILTGFRGQYTENQTIIEMKKEVDKTGDKIRDELLRLARNEKKEGSMKLTPRTLSLRRNIDRYFELLYEAMKTAMTEEGLVRECQARKIGHTRKEDKAGEKQHLTGGDQLYKRYRKLRMHLNKLDNVTTVAIGSIKELKKRTEDESVTIPNMLMRDLSEMTSFITKIGEATIQSCMDTMAEVEEEIEDMINKQKEKERKNMIGLDPIGGQMINREKNLRSRANADDREIYQQMDQLLDGPNNMRIFEGMLEEQDATQDGSETLANSSKSKKKDTNIYWKAPSKLDWNDKEVCRDVWNRIKGGNGTAELQDYEAELRETQRGIRRLRNRMMKGNARKWLVGTREDVLSNELKGVTKMLIKPPFEAPEAHPFKLTNEDNPRDKEGNLKWRVATTVEEEREGTKEKHQDWMGFGGEEKNLYAVEETKDEYGNSQYSMNIVTKPPAREEIKQLYRNNFDLTDEMEEVIAGAHNEASTETFRKVPKDVNFLFPYTVNPLKEDIRYENVRTQIHKSIRKPHGKARHEGFHLASIARCTSEWTEAWIKGFEYILASRIGPRIAKQFTRVPIPKPKPGETRPLALVDDVWGMINDIIYEDLSKAMERAGVLNDDIIAYRKGKGAMDAMIPIILMLEECFVSGEMVAIIDEDEEKYFDRVLTEIQYAAMKAIGLPDEGYLEINSEGMRDRECTIITNRGEVKAQYLIGLMQGQKLSVLVCNANAMAKTRQWKIPNERNVMTWSEGYKPACIDEQDREQQRSGNAQTVIYSDDSSAIIGQGLESTLKERIEENWPSSTMENEEAEMELEENQELINLQEEKLEDIVTTLKAATSRTGDFSIVSKLPRNGGKSSISISNVEPGLVDKIPEKIQTYEHSFAKAGVAKSDINVTYSIRRPGKFATEEEKAQFNNTILETRKLLGVYFKASGDSSDTSKEGFIKAMRKINDTPIPTGIGPKGAGIMANTYITNIINYAVLVAKWDMSQMKDLDKALKKRLARHFGLTQTDTAIDMMRPISNFGGGVKSFADELLCATMRELEELLSSPGRPGVAARSSLELGKQIQEVLGSEKLSYTRCMEHNISLLARFGFYLRDTLELERCVFLEKLRALANQKKNNAYQHMGQSDFKGNGRKETYLGTGSAKLEAFMMGGKYDEIYTRMLKKNKGNLSMLTQENGWKGMGTGHLFTKEDMANTFAESIKCINKTTNQTLTNYDEWIARENDTNPLDKDAKWTNMYDSSWKIDLESSSPPIMQIEKQILKVGKQNRLNYYNNDHEDILDRINKSPLPPIVATDGSHTTRDTGANRNTACAVLFVYEGEEDNWDEGIWTPLMARASKLPEKIGVEKVDNGHGEATALSLAEEMLSTQIPCIMVSDSAALIAGYRTIRDNTIASNRAFVRKMLSGVGKGTFVRLIKNLALWSKQARNLLINSAGIIQTQGVPDGNFNYLGADSNLGHECIDEEEELDGNNPATASELLQWHISKTMNKTRTQITHQEVIRDFLGPKYSAENQDKKLRKMQARLKEMISDEKKRPWPEINYDSNLHRPILKVDSHQLKKNTNEQAGRYENLTPCRAIVIVNHIADQICDLNLPSARELEEDAEEENDEEEEDESNDMEEDDLDEELGYKAPPDIEIEIQGLRFRFTLGGCDITKDCSKTIRRQTNEERRYKAAMRDVQGLLNRVEPFIDMTGPEMGQIGGLSRHLRGQGASEVRAARLNAQFGYNRALDIESKNQEKPNITEKEMRRYLKHREDGVYGLCNHCGKEAIKKHREEIEQFEEYLAYDEEGKRDSIYQPTEINRFDPRRHSVLHSCVCSRDEFTVGRNLGNKLINNRLIDLLEEASEYRVSGVPGLLEYLMSELKETELGEHLVSKGSQKSNDYEIKTIRRTKNETILNKDEWMERIDKEHKINMAEFDKIKAKDSLEKYEEAISIGIFPPESIGPVPIYRQHVLDTSWRGWTPKIYWQVIEKWIALLTEKGYSKGRNARESLKKHYAQLRLAIFTKAELLVRLQRKTVHEKKKSLNEKFTANISLNEENDMNREHEPELHVGEELDEGLVAEDISISSDLTEADEEKEEEEKEGANKERTTKNIIICEGDRCKVAESFGMERGKVSKKDDKCARCKIFEKDMELAKSLERELLKQAYINKRLIECVQGGRGKLKKVEELIKDESVNATKTNIQKRHILQTAKTLALKEGGKKGHIDERLTKKEGEDLRVESGNVCKCKDNDEDELLTEEIEEDSLNEHERERRLPTFCNKCKRVRKLDGNVKDNHCRACNIKAGKVIKLNTRRVCDGCRIKWLLTNNTLKGRYDRLIEAAKDTNNNPTRKAAKEATLNENELDPTLVPKNAKGKNKKENAMKILNKETGGELDDDEEAMIEKMEQYWKDQYNIKGKIKPNRQNILNKDVPMDNRTLMRLLHMMNKQLSPHGMGVVNALFIHTLMSSNVWNWEEMRKWFKPNEEGRWSAKSSKVPHINENTLIIPVCIKMREQTAAWACLLRMRTGDKNKPWFFFLVDPHNNDENTKRKQLKQIRKRMKDRTSLQEQEEKMDNTSITGKAKSTWHSDLAGPTLESGNESAYRMLLTAIILVGSESKDMMTARLKHMNNIEGLEIKTREWIMGIIENKSTFKNMPEWIMEIRNIEHEDEDNMEYSTESEDELSQLTMETGDAEENEGESSPDTSDEQMMNIDETSDREDEGDGEHSDKLQSISSPKRGEAKYYQELIESTGKMSVSKGKDDAEDESYDEFIEVVSRPAVQSKQQDEEQERKTKKLKSVEGE